MLDRTRVEQHVVARAARRHETIRDATLHLMIETLETAISRLYQRPVKISGLHRQVCKDTSSFHAERMRVCLDTGESLRVFFKDLNPEHQIAPAQRVREMCLPPSDRELRVYQSVLSPLGLGTPLLYAARWEPARGIYWLFLENAGWYRLRYCSNFARWVAAARWAARFHAATRNLPDSQTDFLPRYDRDRYCQGAERVEKILPDLENRDRKIVRWALDRFVSGIDRLTELPQSVIHGQYFGQNIMVRTRNPQRLIAVIDWETAAIGPGAFDLVSLTSGKWTGEQRLTLWRAYFDEYRADAELDLEWKAFRQSLSEVGLYQALEWLGWWRHRSLSPSFGRWVKELEGFMDDHPPVA